MRGSSRFKGTAAFAVLALLAGLANSVTPLEWQQEPNNELRLLGADKPLTWDQVVRKGNLVNICLVDKDYGSFWQWYWPWQKNLSASGPSVLDFKEVPSDLALDIVERKAFVESDTTQFSQSVAEYWDEIWSLWSTSSLREGFRASNPKRSEDDGGNSNNPCGKGYYMGPKNKCQACPVGCKSCSDSQDCAKCNMGYTYVQNGKFTFCVPNCPYGYYT